MKKLLVFLLIALTFGQTANAAGLAQELAGKILLQVERNGEAWYVHPETMERHFLYRPAQAFQIMREQGIGITNADLAKIPIGFHELAGTDTDGDGLIDNMERAIGTNLGSTDTDGDGFSDKQEIENVFDPNRPGKLPVDTRFTNRHLGKIFLQVEDKGEAWWINPDDGRRYYLGRADDAFALMRALGLGISNENLSDIPVTATKMNCGNDISCLIAALELDQLGAADLLQEIDFFGLLFDSVSNVEINKQNGSYVYDSTVMSVDVGFSEEALQKLVDEGKTQEEIDQLVEDTNQSAQESVGNVTSCVFPNKENLLRHLEQLALGNISVSATLGSSKVLDPDTGAELGECVTEPAEQV